MSTTRCSCKFCMIRSQTVVLPEAVPPATPIKNGSRLPPHMETRSSVFVAYPPFNPRRAFPAEQFASSIRLKYFEGDPDDANSVLRPGDVPNTGGVSYFRGEPSPPFCGLGGVDALLLLFSSSMTSLSSPRSTASPPARVEVNMPIELRMRVRTIGFAARCRSTAVCVRRRRLTTTRFVRLVLKNWKNKSASTCTNHSNPQSRAFGDDDVKESEKGLKESDSGNEYDVDAVHVHAVHVYDDDTGWIFAQNQTIAQTSVTR